MLKNVLKNFKMSEQYWGCLDKMSEVNFSPAETLNWSYGLGPIIWSGSCHHDDLHVNISIPIKILSETTKPLTSK